MYVVRCCDGSLYTGITTDVDRRVYEHNYTQRAARYTRARRPVKLMYSTDFPDRSSASKAEVKFKRLSRQEKEAAIDCEAT